MNNLTKTAAVIVLLGCGLISPGFTEARTALFPGILPFDVRDTEEWSVSLQAYLNGSFYTTLQFGMKSGASDEFDFGIDRIAPPPPPPPDNSDIVLFSIINEAGYERLTRDYRQSIAAKTTWRMEMDLANGNTMVVNWDSTAFPGNWGFTWQEADANWNAVGVLNVLRVVPPITVENTTGGLLIKKFLIKAFPLVKGDINGDGDITIVDVILCQRMVAGIDTPNLVSADMNSDGVVDISDLVLVLRKALGSN